VVPINDPTLLFANSGMYCMLLLIHTTLVSYK
jgi:alanyl-tRNA synthetase